MFFLSGASWYQVFWTAPAGNQYYNLAHQYMAARLNVLDGASVPASVAAAIASATTLFQTYTPAQIGAMDSKNAVRKQFVELAGILGSYNEGRIGPATATSSSPVAPRTTSETPGRGGLAVSSSLMRRQRVERRRPGRGR